MDSLFSRLQSYCPRQERDPKEDFLTEALCFVLDKNREVLKEYIKFLMPGADPIKLTIETQYSFGRRRPDVVIEFNNMGKEDKRCIIVCEHKLGAGEGDKQLADYYRTLLEKFKSPDIEDGLLVFITKYFVSHTSIDDEGIPQDKFKQIEWREIHTQMVKKEWKESVTEPNKELYNEFLNYMEELGMKKPTKFSALETAEFCRIPKLLGALNECLQGEARLVLESINGKRINLSTGSNFLREPQWTYYTSVFNGTASLNMGVYLDAKIFEFDRTNFGDPEYPELIIYLSSDPKNELRDKHIEFCKRLTKANLTNLSEKWVYTGDKWRCWMVVIHKSMRDFIKDGDEQIEKIQGWFADRLRELKDFIDKNEIPSEA